MDIEEKIERAALDMRSIKEVKNWNKSWQVISLESAKKIIKEELEMEKRTMLTAICDVLRKSGQEFYADMIWSLYYGKKKN